MGGGRFAPLVKVPVGKGTLLCELRVATVPICKSNVNGVWVEGEMYHLWKLLVNKGTLLCEVRVATVHKCKSNVKGVWVEGEVYHLWK